MIDRRLLPFTLVLVLGCDGSKSSNPGPEGTSDTAAESETDGDTDAAGSSGGSSTGDLTTSAGTSTGPGGTGGETSTGTGSTTTCDLNEVVDDAVEGGAVPAEDIVDCGTVVVEDEVSDWVDMRDCILGAAAKQRAYKGFVHRINGLWEAFGSVVGEQYDTQHWILTDTGKVFMERCDPYAIADCEPSPETGTCVSCSGKGNQVCPAD